MGNCLSRAPKSPQNGPQNGSKMGLKRAQNGSPRADTSSTLLWDQNQAFSIGFIGKTTNPSPRTESASVLRIERWSSCQHTAWRVVLGSLIKEARDVSVHAFVYRFCCITLSRAPSSTQSASQSSLAPHSSKSHWVTIAHHFHTLRVHSLCYLIHFLICF